MNLSKVVILGSGGREHALAFYFAKLNYITDVFVFPGNDGMEITPKVSTAKKYTKFSDLSQISSDPLALSDFCTQNEVNLVIVGGELPLAMGFVDQFQKISKVAVLGPSKNAAQLETSKAFAKDFMKEAGIPSAKYKTFKKEQLLNMSQEELEILLHDFGPELPVIKASGLCAGKGVVIAKNAQEFFLALKDFCKKDEKNFDASEIILEEKLKGPEISLFYLCQGEEFIEIGGACDYKRWGDDNLGPNTGGMGCKLPDEKIFPIEDRKFIAQNIVAKTLHQMIKKGSPYNGILFLGLMYTSDGPKVIEYNCRLGDPETQVLIPLMPDNFADALYLAANNNLGEWIFKHGPKLILSKEKSVHVVITHPNYAGQNSKIEYIKELKMTFPHYLLDSCGEIKQQLFIFSSAMKKQSSEYYTNGGRVIGVTATASSEIEAREKAYQAVREIYFEGRHYRLDIAKEISEEL